jgi:hypothetical protein
MLACNWVATRLTLYHAFILYGVYIYTHICILVQLDGLQIISERLLLGGSTAGTPPSKTQS